MIKQIAQNGRALDSFPSLEHFLHLSKKRLTILVCFKTYIQMLQLFTSSERKRCPASNMAGCTGGQSTGRESSLPFFCANIWLCVPPVRMPTELYYDFMLGEHTEVSSSLSSLLPLIVKFQMTATLSLDPQLMLDEYQELHSLYLRRNCQNFNLEGNQLACYRLLSMGERKEIQLHQL